MLRGSGSDVRAEAAGGYEGRLDIPCTRLEDKYSADCGEGALHVCDALGEREIRVGKETERR